jgi:hypothetical protein
VTNKAEPKQDSDGEDDRRVQKILSKAEFFEKMKDENSLYDLNSMLRSRV